MATTGQPSSALVEIPARLLLGRLSSRFGPATRLTAGSIAGWRSTSSWLLWATRSPLVVSQMFLLCAALTALALVIVLLAGRRPSPDRMASDSRRRVSSRRRGR